MQTFFGCKSPICSRHSFTNQWFHEILNVVQFMLDMNYLRKTKPGQAISHTSKVLHGLGLERFSQWNEAACSLSQVRSFQGNVTEPYASGLDFCRNGNLFLRPSWLAQPRITSRYYLFKVFSPNKYFFFVIYIFLLDDL